MAAQLNEALTAALSSGSLQVGQVLIERGHGLVFTMCHIDDTSVDRDEYVTPDAASQIARTDEENRIRPLKTAPTLRRGWVLRLREISEVGLALEHFYPGRLSVLLAARAHRLVPTSLRATLNRQTGMYRVAANISDEQIDATVFETCRSDAGCLRTILWRRDESGAIPSTRLPAEKFDPSQNQARRANPKTGEFLPLLCQEACSVLMEACRRKVQAAKATQ